MAAPLPTPRTLEDTSTLARARTGDLDAFSDLVRAHERAVYGVAFHIVRDAAAAEEIAQDAFVRLHAHLEEMDGPAHVLYWLRQVTARRAIDYARSRRRHDLGEPLPDDVAVERPTPDLLLRRTLRRLVAALPPRARAVVVLRFHADLDPHEIADTLDMPLNTVKSHLRRSLQLLRARACGLRKVIT